MCRWLSVNFALRQRDNSRGTYHADAMHHWRGLGRRSNSLPFRKVNASY